VIGVFLGSLAGCTYFVNKNNTVQITSAKKMFGDEWRDEYGGWEYQNTD